jgi:asparagine synthase (glutamine-hydrolysing)
MNAAMRHRGPDDEGVHLDRETGVALGARRLSIIDVAGGHQPLSNEDGTIWAALNGEIYNHPALQKRLREHGHTLATGSDTEVLVHLYEDFGDDLVHALEGMFAFAILDARRGRLLLARDRFGEKPLFYADRGGELAFASELTALLAGAPMDRDLEPSAVDAYFVHGYVPGPGTVLRGVQQLPPAHLLRWESSTRRSAVERYWRTPEVAAEAVESRDALVEEIGELLEASIRSRMISDVPLGVFLSGGVDSTLIAALAARTSRGPVKTFTVGYDVGSVAETVPARHTAERLGTEHHELVLDAGTLAERVPGLLAGLDQPLADQALVALHAVSEFARGEVTVAVGGEGADELFGGYPRYRWLERAARVEGVVPAGLARGGTALLAALPSGARARRLADVLAPLPTVERHLDWVTDGRRHLRTLLYGPALAGAAANGRLVSDLTERLGTASEQPGPADMMRLDTLHWLPDDVLAKADRASMRVSLELRTPYLHRELAELAASIPADVHIGRRGKELLRDLLTRVAPEVAGPRPKTAFRVPAADWLRGPLAPVVERQLRSGAIFTEGWLSRDAVARLATEHGAGRRDWSGVLWPVLSIGLWLDRLRSG